MDEDLQKRLVALAAASRQTPESLAEYAVREFVERREHADQVSFTALEEWQAFDASGHVGGVPLDKLSPWLDS